VLWKASESDGSCNAIPLLMFLNVSHSLFWIGRSALLGKDIIHAWESTGTGLVFPLGLLYDVDRNEWELEMRDLGGEVNWRWNDRQGG
jgi:hypothetical protein